MTVVLSLLISNKTFVISQQSAQQSGASVEHTSGDNDMKGRPATSAQTASSSSREETQMAIGSAPRRSATTPRSSRSVLCNHTHGRMQMTSDPVHVAARCGAARLVSWSWAYHLELEAVDGEVEVAAGAGDEGGRLVLIRRTSRRDARVGDGGDSGSHLGWDGVAAGEVGDGIPSENSVAAEAAAGVIIQKKIFWKCRFYNQKEIRKPCTFSSIFTLLIDVSVFCCARNVACLILSGI
uniref:Uncharacterized protein n=1 Tax=Oryza brachyantha TaxID=4533 RepID=J3N292_ORYBR